MARLTFSETEIQRLFGHEAAEDEEPWRLRQYYFKSALHDQIVTDLALRILVGHKGIGKSALFQIAMNEDREHDRIAILIKPNDIADIAMGNTTFLKTIQNWTYGLLDIIARKVFNELGTSVETTPGKLLRWSGQFMDFLVETLKGPEKLNFVPAKQALS